MSAPRGTQVRTGNLCEDAKRASGVLADWMLGSVAELSQLLRMQ